jgi:2',3'-cyclic-nucleotide 2'-phosphodiesterase (5'-nucleotidase family)
MKCPIFISGIVVVLLLQSCQSVQPVYQVEHSLVTSNVVGIDSGLYRLMLPYKETLDAQMNAPLVYNTVDMPKELPESALGNMVADVVFKVAQKQGAQPDLAVVNYGGLRLPILGKGMLTVGDAYKLMPFDNLIVIIETPGYIIRQLFSHITAWGGWPISGGSAAINQTEKRISGDIYIGGQLLQDEQTYRLATTDYLAGGGDKCFFLQDLPSSNTGVLLRDAIIDSWQELALAGDSLKIQIEGRLVYVE